MTNILWSNFLFLQQQARGHEQLYIINALQAGPTSSHVLLFMCNIQTFVCMYAHIFLYLNNIATSCCYCFSLATFCAFVIASFTVDDINAIKRYLASCNAMWHENALTATVNNNYNNRVTWPFQHFPFNAGVYVCVCVCIATKITTAAAKQAHRTQTNN